MKKFFAFIYLALALQVNAQVFTQPVTFSTGSITVDSGVPMLGTWDFSGATVTGVPPPTITLTGNATGSGTTSIPVTINTVPDLTSFPGSFVMTNMFSPIFPSAGYLKVYSDNAGKRLHDRNDTGSTGTTVVGSASIAGKAITGIDPITGALSFGSVIGHSVTFYVDGQGSVVTTGTKNPIKIPYGGTLQGWEIIVKPSGSVTFDILRATNGNGLPITSIIGSGTKPAVASAIENSSTNFTNWTSTVLNDKDNLAVTLSGVSTCTYVSLVLFFQ